MCPILVFNAIFEMCKDGLGFLRRKTSRSRFCRRFFSLLDLIGTFTCTCISAISSPFKDNSETITGESGTPCSNQASSSLDIKGFLLLKISQLCSCLGYPAWLYQRGWICARWLYQRGWICARWLYQRGWICARWLYQRGWICARWLYQRGWICARWLYQRWCIFASWVSCTYIFTTICGGSETPCSNQVSSSLDIKEHATAGESNKSPEDFLRENRERHLRDKMSRDEKRKLYRKRDEVTIDTIPSWNNDKRGRDPAELANLAAEAKINEKISIWKGDITRLEIDAIVNAANHHLGGGAGVDGAIHRAAGPDLLKENQGLLKECPIGEARVAAGYRLPAYYVIHTTGPQDGSHVMLERCYKNCLSEVLKNEIRTVAFPGISTGIYGFPMDDATRIAARTVRDWLKNNLDKVDRIIFCVFIEEAVEAAYRIIPEYFPR